MKLEYIGNDRTRVSQLSFDVAEKIKELAKGITYHEFRTAVSMAVEDVEKNFTLVSQPVHELNERG